MTSRRDSLLKVLSNSKDDTFKVLTTIRLGQEYSTDQPESTLYYARAFGILSEKLNYAKGKAYSLSMQALIYSRSNKQDEAISMDLEAIEIAKKANLKKVLANLYNNTGLIYGAKGNLSTSLEFYLKAETMYEQLNDSSSLAFMYGNLAQIYLSLWEYDTSYSYSLKGVLLCRSLHQTFGLMADMVNLSSSLVNLQRFDTALVVLRESQKLSKRLIGISNDTKVLALINTAYIGLNKFDSLKPNSEELLVSAKSLEDSDGICNAYAGLSVYYLSKKNYAKATRYALDDIEIAKKNNYVLTLRDAYIAASRVELEKGNVTEFDAYNNLKDSIDEAVRSDKIVKNTQELEARYSLNKKQVEIDSLNKEKKIQQLTLKQRNTMNWVLASLVLIAGLIAFLFNRNYRQRKKLLVANTLIQQQRITELEKEKRLLAAQAVVQGQVEERTRLAKDLHDGLGSILSSTKYSFNHMKENLIITPENAAAFEKSMAMLDSSINELRRVAHNMMPEALTKFGLDTALKDFCNSVNQSGAIQLTYQSFGIDESTIPEVASAGVYRIIQELVNNILKHADATTALVQIIRNNNNLSITVEDNGKGFDKSILQNNQGMGYLNLKNRVAYMNGSIDIQTSSGKGTSVNIEISTVTA